MIENEEERKLDDERRESEWLTYLAGLVNSGFIHPEGHGSPGIVKLDNGLRLRLYSAEDLRIADEIFQKHIYRFYIPANTVVLDVGAHIGLSALYFAQMPNVKMVYAYEPFPTTFGRMEENLALNPELSEKIVRFNVGWWEEVTAGYSPFDKYHLASNSILKSFPKPPYVDDDIFLKFAQPVKTVDCANAIEDIYNTMPYQITVKLDVEGSEYTILRHLVEMDMLSSIDMLMVELHEGDHVSFIKNLIERSFGVFSPNYPFTDLNLLYAVRMGT